MSAGRGYSGKYKVNDRVTTRVISWTAGVSKEKKTPFIRVNFEGNIQWTGWCSSDKAKEITIKALEVMGFKGTDLGQIKNENALDTNRDIVAVIGEIRKWNNQTFYDAKFINRAPTKGFKADKKEEDVFDTLKDISTTAHIEDAHNHKQETYEPGFDPVFDRNFTADEIPF